MKTLRRTTTKQAIVVELDEQEWEAVAERQDRLIQLERALAAVDGDFLPALQRVAEALPLAAAVETVSIRLLADGTDSLYLVAHEGLGSRHVRDLAVHPIPVARQRTIFALASHHSEARAFELRYLAGEWLMDGSEMLGSITVGSRTDRRPSPAERQLVRESALSLGASLAGLDRSEERLRTHSLALARTAIVQPPDIPEALLTALRPREATVLELYAGGRSIEEIAAELVISPHTVRTHIKLAFRRLGVHSRQEAQKLIRADGVTALL